MSREQWVARLRTLAELKWGPITPCSGRSWDECLTSDPDGRYRLWFNVASGTTRTYTL